MRERPFYFVFLSFFLLLIIISFPFQILYQSNFELKDFLLAFDQLTLQNWILMLACMAAFYMAWNLNSKLNYLVLFLTVYIVVNSFIIGPSSTDQSIFKTSIASILFLVPFSLLLVPDFQYLLSNKAKHWWKTPKRIYKTLEVEIDNEYEKILTKTVNISSTGALIEISPQEKPVVESVMKKTTDRTLKIHLPSIAFESKIDFIRLEKLKNSDNYHLAVHFIDIPLWNKVKLQSFLRPRKMN